MRSPLTDKFLRIVAIRDEVKTWPQDEQDFFLDLLLPESGKVMAKKPRKRSKGKSQRATSLANQIKNVSTGIQRCEAIIDENVCEEPEGHALHEDSTYANYHPFVTQPPAPSAGKRSSSKRGVETGSTPNTGEQPENALAVTGN